MTIKMSKGHLVYELKDGKWRKSVNRMFESGFPMFDILKLKRIKGRVCIA